MSTQSPTIDFGARLRTLRERAGLSLKEAAAAISEASGRKWPWQNVQRRETGDTRVTVDELPLFAAVYGVTIAELLQAPETTGSTVAVLETVQSAFAEAPAVADNVPAEIALPTRLQYPERAFGVYVADDSADLLYPAGSLLIAERPNGGALKVGCRVIVRHFATDRAAGDTMETLVGALDRTTSGDVIVSLRSRDRRLPTSIAVRRAPISRFLGEGNNLPPADMIQLFAYRPQPTDEAEILGVVVYAITPE